MEKVEGNEREYLFTCLERGCKLKSKIAVTDTHCSLSNAQRHLENACWLVTGDKNGKRKKKIIQEQPKGQPTMGSFFKSCAPEPEAPVESDSINGVTIHQNVDEYERIMNRQGPSAEGALDFEICSERERTSIPPIDQPPNKSSKSSPSTLPSPNETASKNLSPLAGQREMDGVSEHY